MAVYLTRTEKTQMSTKPIELGWVKLTYLKNGIHITSVAKVPQAGESRLASAPYSSKVPARDQAWFRLPVKLWHWNPSWPSLSHPLTFLVHHLCNVWTGETSLHSPPTLPFTVAPQPSPASLLPPPHLDFWRPCNI